MKKQMDEHYIVMRLLFAWRIHKIIPVNGQMDNDGQGHSYAPSPSNPCLCFISTCITRSTVKSLILDAPNP